MKTSQLVIAILVVALILRLILGYTAPVTGDAAFHYSYSKYIAQTLSIPDFQVINGWPFTYAPLFHIITAGFWLIGLPNLSPIIIGFLGVAAMYLFAKEFFPKYAELSLILIAFIPLHLYASAIGYTEILMFLIAVLSYHFYFRFMRDGKNSDLAISALFAGLSALVHYTGFIVAFAVFIHLILKNWKKAAAFALIVSIVALPWYYRNYEMFGNPIWPKLNDGYFQGSTQYGSFSLSNLSLQYFLDTYFDFWVGPPNSGADIMKNFATGESKLPLFALFALGWLACILSFTALFFRGVWSQRKKLQFFVIPSAVLLFIIFFTGFGQMGRMFMPILPFIVLGMAAGLDSFKAKIAGISLSRILLIVAVLSFIGSCFAYAFVYKNMVDDYQPYFALVKEKIPSGAIVIDISPEIGYYSGVNRTEIANAPGMVPKAVYNATNKKEFLSKYGNYICTTSLKYFSYNEGNRGLYDYFFNTTPYLEYSRGDVWGRCWSL